MLTAETAPVDRVSRDNYATPRPWRVALLVVGDVVVFLVFAAAGRANHQEAQSLAGVAMTAAPFLAAWLAVAPWIGAFGCAGSAESTRPRRLLPRTAISWVLAGPLGVVLRAIVVGHGVVPSFAVVAFVVNAVLLLVWRSVVSLLFWRG